MFIHLFRTNQYKLIKMFHSRSLKYNFFYFLTEIQSCLSIWDINLPHEVQNLEKHIEVRAELADKMRRTSVE